MKNRKRIVVAAVGVTFFGALVASAASLGGLTSQNLGANDTVVASCDTNGVSVAYTNAYNATAGHYVVTGVTVSGIAAACSGQTLSITLSGTAGASLGSGTVTVAGTSETVAIANANANAVLGAAVVISG